MPRIAQLALAAPALLLLIAAAAPSAGNYVALPDAKGFVSLYDLASLTRADDGFAITSVVDGPFARVFPSVAYRVKTERFHCPTGKIDLVDFAEYDAAGKRIDADRSDQRGIFTIVAGTADSELANWFCAAGQRTPTAGITALGTVTAGSQFAAYQAGLPLMKQSEIYGR